MLVILAFLLLTLIQCVVFELMINRASMFEAAGIFMMPFEKPFLKPPTFGYGIQGLYMESTELVVEHSIVSQSLAMYTVSFFVRTNNNVFNSYDFVDLVLVWFNCPYIEVGMADLVNLHQLVSFKKQHKWNFWTSYSLTVGTVTFPLLWNVTTTNNYGFTIQVLQGPTTPSIKRTIMYFLVEKIFISERIFGLFNVITQRQKYFVSRLINSRALRPTGQNSFQVINQIAFTSPTISLPNLAAFDCIDGGYKPCMKIGFFLTNSAFIKLRATFISFNPKYSKCSSHKYLAYYVPYITLPASCRPCDPSCLTCTSADQDSTWTDFRYCTTCEDNKYVEPYSNSRYGVCTCLKGLEIDSQGNCLPCQFNCLQFRVQYMESAKSPKFFLIFTKSSINFVEQLSENFEVYVDENQIAYQSENPSLGAYEISLPIENLTICQQSCTVKFRFARPEYIQSEDRYLTKQTQNYTLQNFFLISHDLPKQFTQAMKTVNYIVAASTSTGQASLLKMLFELEQTIEAHKYLNMQIPVVFKDFVESLNNFRFLDITTIIPGIADLMKNLSTTDMDCKGHYKVVYYENGANFYKNIITVVISFVGIALLNILVTLILYGIPLKFTKNLAKILKYRWYVTLSQLLQNFILPASLFFTFQINYTMLNLKYLWIYILAYTFCFIIVFYPVIIIGATAKFPNQRTEAETDRLEDLLQDCKLTSYYTYLLYLYGYYKKFFVGLVLAGNFSGFLQNGILMTLNAFHLFLLLAILTKKLYKSIWKMIFRSGTLLSMIILEILISIYNMDSQWDKETKTKLGTACYYISMIATGLGLAEFIAKILEFLIQSLNHYFKCCVCWLKKESKKVSKNKNSSKQISGSNKKRRILSDGSEEKLKLKNQQEMEYQEIPVASTSRKMKRDRLVKLNNKIKVPKQTKEIQQSSRFSSLDKKKRSLQTISDASEIVKLDDYQQSQDQKSLYKRPKNRARANSNNQKTQSGTDSRLNTISTKQQTKSTEKRRKNNDKTKKTNDNTGYRRNKLDRVNDLKLKRRYYGDDQSSMSDIVDMP